MKRSVLECQIRAIEAQLKALRVLVQQEGESQPAKPARALSELRGIFKGKVRTTEQQIRDAEIKWDWQAEETSET
ncbi:MAG: hypothetical protein N2045_07440 [Fimbriimonadales bacterium]|nr:hypothetical protein [Fimbriimonadales bacterium]GBC91011.1 hypothetical protein HRbin14_01767 [bacterium HR14]